MKKKILVISPIFPLPLKSGGQVRVYYLLKYLSRYYEVALISLIAQEDKPHIPEIEKFCFRVETITGRIYESVFEKLIAMMTPLQIKRTVRRFGQLARGIPFQVCRFYHPDIENKISELMNHDKFDAVYALYSQIAPYMKQAKSLAPDARFLLDDIDLAFVTKERELVEREGLGRFIASVESKRMREYVRQTWPEQDCIVAMSEVDKQKLLQLSPSMKVAVIPNGVDTEYFRPVPEKSYNHKIVFLGGSLHHPNVDAMRFFYNEIMPLIRQNIDDATLTVIGEFTETTVFGQGDHVHLTGFVEDLRPYLQDCSVLVAPIRIGGGTRLKILEAMAMGIPVVSTSVGCEGIDAMDGQDVLLADLPEEFAQKVSSLLKQPDMARGLALNGRRLVEQKYSWDSLLGKVKDVFK